MSLFESILLRDEASGAVAKILPALGFNCHSFQIAAADGPLEVLWSAKRFAERHESPSGSGVPILFPFPGRIREGRFAFRGKEYHLSTRGDGRGNAIHGFVLDRPWSVVERGAGHVTGRFRASDVDGSLLDQWPADFCLTARYELTGNRLSCGFTIENPDTRWLPWGLGTHPYFRVPLGRKGRGDDCRIRVPTESRWELDELLPTGKTVPASEHYALAGGIRFADSRFDDVFGSLASQGGICTARIDDHANGRRLVLEFDSAFDTCVVYNPPHRQAISIEPYTCVPDPFTLAAQGIDSGLRTLAPGETFSAKMAITVDSLG